MKKFFAGITFTGQRLGKQFFGNNEDFRFLLEFENRSDRDRFVRRHESAAKVSAKHKFIRRCFCSKIAVA